MGKMSNLKTMANKSYNDFKSSYSAITLDQAEKIWSQEDVGLGISFCIEGAESELVYFGDSLLSKEFVTSNGKKVTVGYISCFTESAEWRWCPIAIFRPAPIYDSRRGLYVDNNSFGKKLVESMKDTDRAKMLIGKTLEVRKVQMDFPKFKDSKRLDEVVQRTVYLWKEVTK